MRQQPAPMGNVEETIMLRIQKQWMNKVWAITVALASMAFAANAQQVALAWSRTQNGAGNGSDMVKKIATDPAGNVYVTGSSIGTGADILTIKYSSNGFKRWEKRFNGTGNGQDEPVAMKVDISGNVYVGGITTSNGTGVNFITLKYNSSGTLLWSKVYDGPGGADYMKDLVIDDAGNVYVCGSYGVGSSSVLLKYDTNGNQLWASAFGGFDSSGQTSANAIAIAGNTIWVAGHSHHGSFGEDFLLMKYDQSGNLLFIRNFNGSYGGDYEGGFGDTIEDTATHITVDSFGNVYVAGTVMRNVVNINGENTPFYDYALAKWDGSGNPLWSRQYGNLNDDEHLRDMTLDGGENPVLTGSHYTMKYLPNGNLSWVVNEGYNALTLDSSNNVYVTRGGTNMVTAKYHATGGLHWSTTYNGPSNMNDFGTDIAVKNGNIYTGGYTVNSAPAGNDFAIVKHVQFPYVKVDTTHAYWNDLVIEVGVGNPDAPLWSKVIRSSDGGNSSGATTTMESIGDAPSFYQTPSESVVWYCKVRDIAPNDTGTLTLFQVRNGLTYSTGNIPAAIPDLGSVMAYVPTRTTQHALIDIEHTYRGDLTVIVGVGPTDAPLATKVIANGTGASLDNMWCQVDIASLAMHLPPLPSQYWWVKVVDQGLNDTGSIRMFQVRNNALSWAAQCLPVPIMDFTTRYAFIPKLMGDTNCDNCVNDEDLLTVLINFGKTGSNMPGDLNGNGIIDDHDLQIVLFNFGMGCE